MNAATLAGGAAILLWSTLAWLAAGATRIPPLELLALTFGVASVLGLAYALGSPRECLSRRAQAPGGARAHHRRARRLPLLLLRRRLARAGGRREPRRLPLAAPHRRLSPPRRAARA
jgi:hypothetical protein